MPSQSSKPVNEAEKAFIIALAEMASTWPEFRGVASAPNRREILQNLVDRLVEVRDGDLIPELWAPAEGVAVADADDEVPAQDADMMALDTDEPPPAPAQPSYLSWINALNYMIADENAALPGFYTGPIGMVESEPEAEPKPESEAEPHITPPGSDATVRITGLGEGQAHSSSAQQGDPADDKEAAGSELITKRSSLGKRPRDEDDENGDGDGDDHAPRVSKRVRTWVEGQNSLDQNQNQEEGAGGVQGQEGA
ncbi:hypothetical protein EJ06DRAFT_553123 [Trichodelitschia bisporula]|uniref:Uncharacterized protein n=1 Tax=Trichodelitschia bisporula TaxID=703511 RepID=A0A6G1I7B9_9PEZI|nr:hypothetical protein EJ06DRAFT_553123 [Trichodelitschia bisporula]